MKHPIAYSEQEEYLLSLWADRALCYKMMHEEAQQGFKKQHMWFSIPVIILSTLTGTANVGISTYVPSAFLSNAQLIIGAVNLLSGVISTLHTFFRAAERCESHRNASVGWGKLYRSIFVELSLERTKRKPLSEFMRISKNEYDRLIDNSPTISERILVKFSERLTNHPSISLPEECGNLMHASSWEYVKETRIAIMELTAQDVPLTARQSIDLGRLSVDHGLHVSAASAASAASGSAAAAASGSAAAASSKEPDE